MAFNFNTVVFNELVASNGNNYHNVDDTELDSGIPINSALNSELVNSFFYKISSSLKQLQENGLISYIPEKTYNEGNVVLCNTLINNTNNMLAFRCKKDGTTNKHPIKNIDTNDDNGFIRFTLNNKNDINSEYWDLVVFNKQNVRNVLSIDEIKGSIAETNNNDFEYVELFDLNNEVIPNENNYYKYSSFNVTIKRANHVLSFDCNINIDNNKSESVMVNINNVYVDDINACLGKNFNSNSKFVDISLLGTLFIINDSNHTMGLLFMKTNNSITSPDNKIHIEVNSIDSSIYPTLIKKPYYVSDPIISSLNVYKLPIIENSTNDYVRSFDIVETFEELKDEYMFTNGLVKLNNSENVLDPMVYSSLLNQNNRSIQGYAGQYKTPISTNNFIVCDSDADINTNRYRGNELPGFKFVIANSSTDYTDGYHFFNFAYNLYNRKAVTTDPLTLENNISTNTTGLFKQFEVDQVVEQFPQVDSLYAFELAPNREPHYTLDSYFIDFDSTQCHRVYSNTNTDKVFLTSVKVYRYMKLF